MIDAPTDGAHRRDGRSQLRDRLRGPHRRLHRRSPRSSCGGTRSRPRRSAITARGLPRRVACDGATMDEVVKHASGKTGEAVSVKRVAEVRQARSCEYRHFNGQVGVLVEVARRDGRGRCSRSRAKSRCTSPRPIRWPSATCGHPGRASRRVSAASPRSRWRPKGSRRAIRAKIVDGKVKKFAAERTLLEQPFVKDESSQRSVRDGGHGWPGRRWCALPASRWARPSDGPRLPPGAAQALR